MRVAVYSIAKDEEANVEGWVKSAWDADHILLVDTGSTDATLQIAGSYGGVRRESIRVDPWRFDDARNAALALVPPWVDYCIALDLDERLQPGWRAALEAAVAAGITRPMSRFTWNWNPDGSPGIVFLSEKAHARAGYRWKHPVHEVIAPTAQTAEIRAEAPGLEVWHHADDSKPRSSYLPLLELAVAEDPDDDRNVHYLGREYLFAGHWALAEDTFRRHLEMPRAVWAPERAASMRYLAEIAVLRRGDGLGGYAEAEGWLLRSAAEAPDYREPWYALMRHYQGTERPDLAQAMARRGLEVTERRLDYITTPEPWSGVMEEVAREPAALGHRQLR